MKKFFATVLSTSVLAPAAFAHTDSGTDPTPVIEISVRDFGAIPNDNNDDTAEIQAAIDAAVDTGKHSLRFESGIYEIEDTIHIPKRMGLKITGEGALVWQNPTHANLSGQGTAIVWTDTTSPDTMFRYRGANLVFSDIAIWGAEWSSTNPTTHATIGFLCTKRNTSGTIETGVGTGKINFHNFVAAHLDVGVQATEDTVSGTEHEENNDNFLFSGRTQFWHCDTGLKVLSPQNMGFHFQDLWANSSEIVFDFLQGGGLKVERVLMNGVPDSSEDPIYLKLHEPATNNGYFHTEAFKLDGNVDDAKIVEMIGTTTPNPEAKITFNSLHLSASNDYNNPLFTLWGRTMLTLRDGRLRDMDGTAKVLDLNERANGDRPNVHFDRVRFDGDAIDLVIEDSTAGGFFFSGSNCLRTDGVPHNDWKFTEDSFPPTP